MFPVLKQDLDTPALLVDLDLVERNIADMAAFFRGHGVGWRPHTKGQKVPEIAHMEIEAGALGITCAKLGEAEVMAQAGIRDILIANQVVGRRKAERLAALLDHADVIVAVDSLANGEELGAAAQARGKRLRVIVEVDNGMQRAGVAPGAPSVALARRLSALPGLRFCGVMAWEAHCLGRPTGERRRCCEEAVGALVATARQCREAGLDARIVSCGGTGTFRITAGIEGVTEIQAGGGIFSDVLYESWGIEHPFALTVMSTVTSRPAPERIITDAGRKAMSIDIAAPRPIGIAHVEDVRLSAEHGIVTLSRPDAETRVGDKLQWIVGYGDTTVFLHDEMAATRGERVEAIWPVLARGKIK